ncbi:hypothetical protein B0H10DRAFT_2093666, partial [Mycena sp. CBHHK59/15]
MPIRRGSVIRGAVPWLGILVWDIIVLALTLRRVYVHKRAGVAPGALLQVMVRDGAAYFSVMCFVNLANILMLYLGDAITADSLTWSTTAVSMTLTSRLMLHLHDVAHGTLGSSTDGSGEVELETVRFRQDLRALDTSSHSD